MAVQEQIVTESGMDLIGNLAPGFDPAGMSADDILGLGFVLTLLLCIYLEGRRPFLRRGVKRVMQSYRTNFATFFFNDITLWLLSVPSLYFVADRFSGTGLLSLLADGPMKYLLSFLLLDFTLYAWHYFMHHCDSLWTFHRVHHSDPDLNVTTGLRFHTGELILEVIVRAAFIVALGISAEALLASQAIISLFILLHHANTVLPGERWLSLIFIVPRLHRVHHSIRREEHDSNYGAVFSLWDRLFGTLKEQEPVAIGLADTAEPGFLGLLKSWLPSRTMPAKAPILVPARNPSDYRR